MALIGLSPVEEQDYTSHRDPNAGDPTQATVFRIGTLDTNTSLRLRDTMTTMESGNTGTRIQINRGTYELDIVRYGLRGWRNFKDKNNHDIEFKTVIRQNNGITYNVVADECINRLPQWLITELANAIVELNSLTKEQEKNLDTP